MRSREVRSMRMPSATVAWPLWVCASPRVATGTAFLRAYRMTAATSWVDAGRTTTPGTRWIIRPKSLSLSARAAGSSRTWPAMSALRSTARFVAITRSREILSGPAMIPDREGWRVMYVGDSSRDLAASGMVRKGLSIVAETTFSPDAGQLGTLALVIPPRTAPATIQSYVRSLEQAEVATIGRPEGGQPLLEAVVREKDGTFTVYVISQQREEGERDAAAGMAGSVLFGRDYMVRIAASGRQVLSVEKLHDGHASMPLQPRAPGAPLLHEHDKGDLPAPTDVALVLRHRVLAPLLVLTQRFMFRIDGEGAVTWLGSNPNPKPGASPAAGPAPPHRADAP